jgi:hypothetical protein
MNIFPKISHQALGVTAVLISSAVAGAQTYRGGIAGTVEDASGAKVVGAKVTLTNPDTGYTRETESTSAGDYAFQDLQPSNAYVITVTSSGFGTVKIDKISVRPGQVFGLDPKLAVNGASESVEVNAAAIALDTISSTNNNVVNEKAVANIPLNGRDFTQLVKITPGVNGAGSVNGTRTNQNNYTIDGADSNDIWQNNTAANQGGVGPIAGVTLPVEAIDQFTVQSSGNAEAGRNPGGLISLGLKTGTNKFHGSAYYYGRSEFFAARDWFQADNTRKTKVRNQQFGASLGGPIMKDKLFFFLNWERQKYVIQIPGTAATEPGAAYIAKATALLANHNVAVNPLSRALITALYQGGNAPGLNSTLNNYVETTPRVGYSDNVVGNLNYILTSKQTLRLQAFIGTGRQVEPASTASPTSWYFQAAPDITQNFSISHNWAATDHLSNQLLVGLGIFNQTFNDNRHDFNMPALGLNTGVTNPSLFGAPTITMAGFDTVGATQPLGRKDYTGHITDAATWVHGKHQFRFGGEYRRNYMDLQYQNGVRGNFTISGTASANVFGATPAVGAPSRWSSSNASPTVCTGQAACGGVNDTALVGTQTEILSLADFMSGYYTTATILAGNLRRDMYRTDLSFFIQDSYHATPRLTLNYGIRHEFTGALSSNGPLSAFRPGTSGANVNGLVQVGNAGLAPTYRPGKLHFSPRVGFNYNPTDKLIVRGNYGLYFDAPPFNGFLDSAPGTTGTTARGLQGNPIGGVSNRSLGTGQWIANQPVFQNSTTAAQVGLFSIDPNLKVAYAHNFNLATEYQVSRNTVFTLGYSGSLGVHLYTMLDINQPGIGTGTSLAAIQPRRPFNAAFGGVAAINQVSSPGNSNYHSVQTSLKTSGYHGLTGQISYTLGHSLDNTSGFRSTGPINSYNLGQDYGNASFDVRHTMNAYVVYEAPQIVHALPVLTKGWQVNGFVTAFTGSPLNITVGDNTGTGQGKDRASWKNNNFGAEYKNGNTSIQQISGRKAIQYYTAFAQSPFVIPVGNATSGTATAASYGNMRRNQLRGPGFFTVDTSVVKNTQIREGVNLQIRAEMFNLFNRVNAANPTTTPTSAAFGQITAGRNSGFGAGSPFNVQFAGKLIF